MSSQNPRSRRRDGLIRSRLISAALALCVFTPFAALAQTRPQRKPQQKKASVPARWRAALERVSAEDMKGHLSFIASDALEGRMTPSRGLDLAAEYIAAQFRRAGLEPAGDDGYFQNADWAETYRDLISERAKARVPAPGDTPVRVRNVAGILRGSDPTLKDTFVIVSAHYDHIGVRRNCDASKEDCINNGANDDGSGTVGVIDLAAALSKLNPRPKRSILFVTFFGEELGLVGSRYYGRHPLVPLAKTVAQVNMEQVGRTDDSEGQRVNTLGGTGFGYSDVSATVERACEMLGVKVFKHPKFSDEFFGRSDNQSLADAGIPAHTLGVAFDFPDYHKVGDEWPKVDYANMERIVRAVGLAALLIADDPREPRWNEQNPKTAPYVEAWKKLHGQ